MFERIKYLYNNGSLNEQGVRNAVLKGWITEAQFTEITGLPY